MLIVDGHQDLAWNVLHFNRDYSRPAAETRRLERGTDVPTAVGDTLLGWPDYQRGCVAVIFASLFASPARCSPPAWERHTYTDSRQAARLYRTQIDIYERLQDEHPEKFRLVHSAADLIEVLAAWPSQGHCSGTVEPSRPAGDAGPEADDPSEADEAQFQGNPVGLVLLMEGAEAVQEPPELEEWWEIGLRFLGPAWMGNRYTGGTNEPGPLTAAGLELLDVMADLGFGLDLSHMDDKAALQALDRYPGTILATHTTAAALLRDPGNRFSSDRVIRGLIERDGVLGLAPLNPFLVSGWRRSDGRHVVTLDHVVAQIDHVCQLAGDARHVALGSDFDGGLGVQMVPSEIDTVADLQKLAPKLLARGYSEDDTAAVLGKNWLRLLEKVLP